ncbi:MAG TPA: DUF3253 domain-containing protein [Acidiphilium sp.]
MTDDPIFPVSDTRANAGIDAAAAAILDLLREAGPEKSISPADAARHLGTRDGAPGAWQRHLPAVRRAVNQLAEAGAIEILRKGKPVSPEAARGVIRLRLAADFGNGEARVKSRPAATRVKPTGAKPTRTTP